MIIVACDAGYRPDWDEYFIAMAHLVSTRGTCKRRRTGCVLVNKHHHVIATGYNGRPSGASHCLDAPCTGVGLPSGQGLDQCEANHAEANALLQCRNTQEIMTAYCTDSPCIGCVKLLQNTSCQRIVFARPYAHDAASCRLWENVPMTGRSWEHYPIKYDLI